MSNDDHVHERALRAIASLDGAGVDEYPEPPISAVDSDGDDSPITTSAPKLNSDGGRMSIDKDRVLERHKHSDDVLVATGHDATVHAITNFNKSNKSAGQDLSHCEYYHDVFSLFLRDTQDLKSFSRVSEEAERLLVKLHEASLDLSFSSASDPVGGNDEAFLWEEESDTWLLLLLLVRQDTLFLASDAMICDKENGFSPTKIYENRMNADPELKKIGILREWLELCHKKRMPSTKNILLPLQNSKVITLPDDKELSNNKVVSSVQTLKSLRSAILSNDFDLCHNICNKTGELWRWGYISGGIPLDKLSDGSDEFGGNENWLLWRKQCCKAGRRFLEEAEKNSNNITSGLFDLKHENNVQLLQHESLLYSTVSSDAETTLRNPLVKQNKSYSNYNRYKHDLYIYVRSASEEELALSYVQYHEHGHSANAVFSKYGCELNISDLTSYNIESKNNSKDLQKIFAKISNLVHNNQFVEVQQNIVSSPDDALRNIIESNDNRLSLRFRTHLSVLYFKMLLVVGDDSRNAETLTLAEEVMMKLLRDQIFELSLQNNHHLIPLYSSLITSSFDGMDTLARAMCQVQSSKERKILVRRTMQYFGDKLVTILNRVVEIHIHEQSNGNAQNSMVQCAGYNVPKAMLLKMHSLLYYSVVDMSEVTSALASKIRNWSVVYTTALLRRVVIDCEHFRDDVLLLFIDRFDTISSVLDNSDDALIFQESRREYKTLKEYIKARAAHGHMLSCLKSNLVPSYEDEGMTQAKHELYLRKVRLVFQEVLHQRKATVNALRLLCGEEYFIDENVGSPGAELVSYQLGDISEDSQMKIQWQCLKNERHQLMRCYLPDTIMMLHDTLSRFATWCKDLCSKVKDATRTLASSVGDVSVGTSNIEEMLFSETFSNYEEALSICEIVADNISLFDNDLNNLEILATKFADDQTQLLKF